MDWGNTFWYSGRNSSTGSSKLTSMCPWEHCEKMVLEFNTCFFKLISYIAQNCPAFGRKFLGGVVRTGFFRVRRRILKRIIFFERLVFFLFSVRYVKFSWSPGKTFPAFMSKLPSTCPSEQFDETFISEKIPYFQIFFECWAKNFRLLWENFELSCQNCVLNVCRTTLVKDILKKSISNQFARTVNKETLALVEKLSAALLKMSSVCQQQHFPRKKRSHEISFFSGNHYFFQ